MKKGTAILHSPQSRAFGVPVSFFRFSDALREYHCCTKSPRPRVMMFIFRFCCMYTDVPCLPRQYLYILILSSSAGSVGTYLAFEEFQLEQRLLLLLASESFSFVITRKVLEEPSFPIFAFVGHFFQPCTSMVWSSIYVLYCSSARTTQHSTARHSTAQHTASSPQKNAKASTCRSVRQRKQADRVGESQHVVEHLHSTLQTNEETAVCPAYKNAPLLTALVGCAMDLPIVSISIRYTHGSVFTSFFYAFRTCMRRPGCFPGAWSSWHLQLVGLHLKLYILRSVSYAFCSKFFLVSERSGGRRKPHAERSALNGGAAVAAAACCETAAAVHTWD